MHKVLALYPQPKDPAHFKKYYEEKHLPLAAQMPGLISSRYSFAVEGAGAPRPTSVFGRANLRTQRRWGPRCSRRSARK